MKVRTVSMSLRRNVRLMKYHVSQCEAGLIVELEEGETLEEIFPKVKDDVQFIVEGMIKDEQLNHEKVRKDAIENKR